MNVQNFSDQFDTLLSSYSSQALFGESSSKSDIVLDEYEKSLLLTQAQDIIVKSHFNGKNNAEGEGFDDSSKRQIEFSSLITTATLSPLLKEEEGRTVYDRKDAFDDRGIIYTMPLRKHPVEDEDGNIVWESEENTTDVLFILNEKLITTLQVGQKVVTKNYVVVPINYKEYDREMSKAYAQPLKKQAWRLCQNNGNSFDIKTELIPIFNLETNETIKSYKIRYVRRPCPIVLTDLPDGLTIDGFDKTQECELNPILHLEILQKAVELAIATKGKQNSPQSSQQQ